MPLDEELIALRREIHSRPELAGEERETVGLVAEQLRAAGLEVTTGVGGHGVVAVLDGAADGPTVAYWADVDFDALLDPDVAASRQESVWVATWTEPGADGQPAVGVLLRVWPQERLPDLRAQVERLATTAGGQVAFQGAPFPALMNSPELSTATGTYLITALGPESVLWARAS